jgi:hypothetical protein
MHKWLVGMSNDGTKVAVFPMPQNKGVTVSPDSLLRDLQVELQQYE